MEEEEEGEEEEEEKKKAHDVRFISSPKPTLKWRPLITCLSSFLGTMFSLGFEQIYIYVYIFPDLPQIYSSFFASTALRIILAEKKIFFLIND